MSDAAEQIQTSMPGGASDDPDQIQAEIEHTRAEMTETIDAISEKLNPDVLKEQAKEMVKDATIGKVQEKVSNVTGAVTDAMSSVKDTVTNAVGGVTGSDSDYDRSSNYGHGYSTGYNVSGTGFQSRQQSSGVSGVMDSVRSNPVPAALVGVGLGWFLMRSRQSKSHGDQRYYYDPQRHTTQSPIFNEDYRPSASGSYGYGNQGQYQSQGQNEQGRMGQVTSTISDTASSVQETAGQFAGQAREQVGHVPQMARSQGQNLQGWYEQKLQTSPMTLGLVAAGLGAAAGLMLPTTEREGQIMGERRDQVVDRAQTMAQETVQKVQSVAQDVTGAVTETIQDSAQQQGLTG